MKALLTILSILILLSVLVYLSYKMFTEGPHPWDFYDVDKENEEKQN